MYLSPKNLQAEMQREKIVKRFGCQAALDSLLFRLVDGGGAEPDSCTGYLCGDRLANDGYQVLTLDQQIWTTVTIVLY